jgi:hypothetical protein
MQRGALPLTLKRSNYCSQHELFKSYSLFLVYDEDLSLRALVIHVACSAQSTTMKYFVYSF